jgi:hypothetical protein
VWGYLEARGEQAAPALVLEPVHAEEPVLLTELYESLQGGERILGGHGGAQAAHAQLRHGMEKVGCVTHDESD